MRNKDLDPKIGLPLKVITARLEHVKINLTGLIKRVEAYAIDRQKSDDLHECLISGDEWTYAALDCKDPIWRTRLKRTQNIMGIQSESTEIPYPLSTNCLATLVKLSPWVPGHLQRTFTALKIK